jgi:hypothetical protein
MEIQLSKEKFDAKYIPQIAENYSDLNLTSTELDILFNIYEYNLQKKIENNKLKRRFNADLMLEETVDFIEQKRKEDLESAVYNIKERFRIGSESIKKIK